MTLRIESVHEWLGENEAQRNYQWGEKLLDAKFMYDCGIIDDSCLPPNVLAIKACCSSGCKFKTIFYEISGQIDRVTGKILYLKCECVAGAGGKCKHAAATLLFCTR